MKGLFVLALFVVSCAGVSGAWQGDTPAATPQAIMTGAVCTNLPIDHTPSINVGAGWTKDSLQCGTKYASGSRACADAAKCGPIVYSMSPGENDRGKPWHFVVDGWGSFAACAEPANRIGFHNINCKPIEFSGNGIRAVLETTVPPLSPGVGEQTATTVQVTVWARSAVKIGQIGPVETPTP